jgi:hypothetical protein
VSFIQRQQTLCWVKTPGSKAKVKGVLVFSSVSIDSSLEHASLSLIMAVT